MTAILTAALFTAFSIAFRARGQVRALGAGPAQFAVAVGVIERDLENALPRPASASTFDVSFDTGGGTFSLNGSLATGSTLANVLDGNATSLQFYALCTDPASGGELLSEGIRRITLLTQDDGDTLSLVRRVERNLLADSAVVPPDETLVTGLSEIGFRYFDGQSWSSSTTTLSGEHPAAVEITLAQGEDRLVAVVPVAVDGTTTVDLSTFQLGAGN